MPPHPEPANKRTVAFFDGQNVFYSVKASFGYTYSNFSPQALALALCAREGWDLAETRFYTGVPDAAESPLWNTFWNNKLAALGRLPDMHVFSRPLRYSTQEYTCPNGDTLALRVGREKGVDVRIAIDIITLARQNAYDVALVFSQDQDLSEAAATIRAIAREKGRWIKIASAFPANPLRPRGINQTDWKPFDKTLYDTCIDPADYR